MRKIAFIFLLFIVSKSAFAQEEQDATVEKKKTERPFLSEGSQVSLLLGYPFQSTELYFGQLKGEFFDEKYSSGTALWGRYMVNLDSSPNNTSPILIFGLMYHEIYNSKSYPAGTLRLSHEALNWEFSARFYVFPNDYGSFFLGVGLDGYIFSRVKLSSATGTQTASDTRFTGADFRGDLGFAAKISPKLQLECLLSTGLAATPTSLFIGGTYAL